MNRARPGPRATVEVAAGTEQMESFDERHLACELEGTAAVHRSRPKGALHVEPLTPDMVALGTLVEEPAQRGFRQADPFRCC